MLKQITHLTFSIPAIEFLLKDLYAELQDFAQTQGRQDGQKDVDITEPSFQIKISDYIRSRGQHVIDFIKQTVLVASQVLHVRELEQTAKHACEQIQLTIDDKEHQLVALERAKKSFVQDLFKLKYAKWLLPLAIFVGGADGVLAYAGFRSASYSTMQAFIASMAITLIIATSHILYAPWVFQSKNKWQRSLKIGGILTAAFLFFYWISNIRAEGINNTINLTVSASNMQVEAAPHISQWAICGISFALFAVILFSSLLVWRSREERLCDAKYQKICADINRLKNEMQGLEKEIADTKNRILAQKRDTRIAYDYVRKAIQRTKHICDGAIATYKQTYVRFHQTVPVFLTNTPELQYDENLQLFEPEKQEV